MITNFFLDHRTLMPVVLVLIAAVCIGVGYRLLRADRNLILWGLAGLAMLPVVMLTFTPLLRRGAQMCTLQFDMPTIGSVELWANVALFFPPVFFAALATRRPLLMLVAGTLLSAAIETVQALVPAFGRTCDTNDWAMNTAGAVLAALLAAATIALARRVGRVPAP